MENTSEYIDKVSIFLEKLVDLLLAWAPKLLLAIVLLVVGIIVINRLVRLMRRVKAVLVFNTILTTPDNVTITIPNGAMSSGSITNYSQQETRRLDLVFGIA